jgi:cyclopropane fatty-acyl-phospholipid synthase-like methyltransferase
MTNTLPSSSKVAVRDFLFRATHYATGIAGDFWADGTENPFEALRPKIQMLLKRLPAGQAEAKATAQGGAANAAAKEAKNGKNAKASSQWHAEPGEISEKMWGAGIVTPGGNVIWDAMVKPLGLNKSMSVLELSAGLGGNMRKVAEETGAYITGLEPDAGVAARGMDLSRHAGQAKHAPVTHYEAAKVTFDRHYDAVLARETFYRVADKTDFFIKLGETCKPQAQIAFTDYIVDPENRKQSAIAAWMANEKGAAPLGLLEMAEAWAKVGFTLRVHEDLSAFYAKEVAAGLRRLSHFLAASKLPPDAETKTALLRRINIWQSRLKAMEQGMKFYRFYGTKQ